MASENTVRLSDSNFDSEVLNSATPVLVDFWAPWCAPCRAIGPVVDLLAKEYDGKVKVAKINIDDNPDAAARFQVSSIPRLVVFKEGKVVGQIIGAVPRPKIEELLRQAL
jgi:thioredoxin 1